MAEKHLSGKHPVVHDSYLNYIYSKKQTNHVLILYPSGDDELRRIFTIYPPIDGPVNILLNEVWAGHIRIK